MCPDFLRGGLDFIFEVVRFFIVIFSVTIMIVLLLFGADYH